MTTPREPVGGAFEASRLLQEGLELLAQRTREVDAVVQQAQERARQHIEEAQERADDITAAAERRANEITADAERSRIEVEAQLAALRGELAEARRELNSLRTQHSDGASKARAAIASVTAAASAVAAGSSSTATAAAPKPGVAAGTGTGTISQPPPPIVIDTASTPEASDAGAAPRWGRRASMPQATPSRPARRRWLPPWLPFMLLLLAGIAIVTAMFSSQAGAGGQPNDQPTNAVIVVTLTAPSPTPTPRAPELGVAAATTIATSVAVAASSLGGAAPSGTPVATSPSAASPGPSALPTVLGQARATTTPRLGPTTLTQARPANPGASSPRVAVPSPIAPKPDAAVVGAYTAYSTYVVRAGDTLNQVAEQVGVSRESIISASQLSDPNLLQPGQVLTIPHDTGWLYRVQPADTLEQIAQRFGVGLDALMAGNALPSPVVHAGDLLLIPNLADSGPK